MNLLVFYDASVPIFSLCPYASLFFTHGREPRDEIERGAGRISARELCGAAGRCPCVSDSPPWLCTRAAGHPGDHVASAFGVVHLRWAQVWN